MNNSSKTKLKFRLVFTAFLFLSVVRVYAQPADAMPIIKYAINNYSAISKGICDTCPTVVGKPLLLNRPIPAPPVSGFDALTGIDPKYIPGIIAPNFIGGGSPEIKGLVKKVAGMTNFYAQYTRQSDKLYFRTGAKDVAFTKSGQIITASGTILPGERFDDQNLLRGFFSFRSSPQRLPVFNSTSDQVFDQSSKQFIDGDGTEHTYNMEVIHFVVDPTNEKVIYASLQNPEATSAKVLARKNPDNGKWEILDWRIPNGLTKAVWGALAIDHNGNLYVADATHHVIIKVTFDNVGKAISWQILGGQMDMPGFVNDNNPQNARYNAPSGICVDLAGNIYIGDAGNNVIRKINGDGDVTTYAGNENGDKGFVDDDDWNDAKFWGPTALAYNEETKALYVVDYNNKLIREINEKRNVSTITGNAGSLDPSEPARLALTVYYVLAKLNMDPDEAKLDNPTGIAIDPSGFGLYVSDGQYIKYVNTSETSFHITAAVGDPKATQLLGVPIPPRLPVGLHMNENNGSFYGVPLEPWEPTIYTVSVINHVTKNSLIPPINGFIRFEVVACQEHPEPVIVNKTISSKELPYTWNGKIFAGGGTDSVTLKNSIGCDSLVKLNLFISPELYYNTEPYILSFGQQIKPIVPTTAGSKIETFSVAPQLPAGLVLNAQTGEITGTPTAYIPGQPVPAVGSRTPPQYPAPWTLQAERGADLTGVKISDGNGKVLLENNSAFRSLVGTAGQGTGTAGAYTDFSGLGAIKMYSNSPYSLQLSNALAGGYGSYPMNQLLPYLNFMNSYAVYIDYNRDGDFEDLGEKVYISASPQTDAHTETFALNIPASATAGVTKMRIYAVEAKTRNTSYINYDPSRGLVDQIQYVERTTAQALSFYPFFDSISNFRGSGEKDFHTDLDYGEFEDYNIDIITPPTQGYVVNGTNSFGSAQSTIKIAVSKSTSSTTNLTICQNQIPYKWNNLTLTGPGTKTDTLKNVFAADSIATINLTVNQPTQAHLAVEHCGPYNFYGQIVTASGDYRADLKNVAGCDSTVYLTFRQKATSSVTIHQKTPNDLPYTWNGIKINTAGTYYDTLTNKENCDSIATLKVLVQYNITYATNNLLTLNKTITPINPQIQGGYTPPGGWYNSAYGYSISPALPTGLSLDPITGIISGTPTDSSLLKTYTVTLNQEGAQPATFTLSVGAPSFSTTTIDNCGPLTWNNVVYDKAGTFKASLKNQYGYDSTATLILTIRNLSASTTILNLNPSQLPFIWNDSSITKEGLHTVHLKNAVGCDSAATANVVIGPKISYVSPQILQPNQAIAAIAPQNTGGSVINYSITPSLVKGLQFDAATGIITGTPAESLLRPVTHSIKAFNRAGTDSTKILIAVCNPMATSFSIDTCSQYLWNDSTYINSTTDTRTLTNKGGCDSVVTMHLNIRKASTGVTTTVTACGNYVWYGNTYDKTGIYTHVFKNAARCDSTLTLNLTVNYPTVNNLYVNLNASDFPYKWKTKTFTAPGSDTVLLKNRNSVGCDSIIRMTASISALLPDITYAVTDTVLYWEKSITTPIAMTNTGTPVPAMKLGQTDTLMKLSNSGPGDFMRNTVKGPDGAYYASAGNIIYRLGSSGAWTQFAVVGNSVNGMTFDKAGNLYVATSSDIKKITPAGDQSSLDAADAFWNINMVAVDADNNLTIIGKAKSTNNLSVIKLNLTTNKVVQLQTGSDVGYDNQDIKVDSKGNIYVLQNYAYTLLKIKPDGRRSTIGSDASYSTQRFKAGNGPDAAPAGYITSVAIDPTNDNVYLMAYGQILRVDTAENVTAVTGTWFDQSKDHIFRVDGGKVSIINNTARALFTANVYGVGSLPFMNNYGLVQLSFYYDPATGVNYTDFDKRIRLDSSGAIVGTPRSEYSSIGTNYANNNSTNYTIIAANQYGVSTASMVINTKQIVYKRESFVTTNLPFVWRGRSFYAATDTAMYFVGNKSLASDTMYLLHLVYEGAPKPIVTATGLCSSGGTTLTANGAAKNAISFDGTNVGIIKNVQNGSGGLGYYNMNSYLKSDGTYGFNSSSSFEVWIKPASVSGTQYLLTMDTVKTHGTFFGYSIQNGKFVYEFTKGRTAPFTDYKLSSVDSVKPNVWTHVAASYYDSTMYIFINGKLEGTYQTPEGSYNILYSEAPGSTVGIFPDFSLAGLGSQLGYKGEMDELRLWSKRRNADSIKATMNNIVDPTTPALGLYYRFDGDVSEGASDISSSGRRAMFRKPATSVPDTMAPINFASYNWASNGATTKSIVVNPPSKTLYTVTVTDYKKTQGSDSLLVLPHSSPGVTPPPSITRTNGPSTCLVMVSDAELGQAKAVDNCSELTVQRTGVPAGNLFPVGVTTITYTATNSAGTKSATQTVTVTDNQKPVITSNGNQAVNNDKDVCGAAVKVSANATDNCSVGAPTGVRSDGLVLSAVYPVGTTTITWNVADANGNAALPVKQIVTVTDNQKPVITSNGNQVVNNDKDVCGAAVKVSANATDNCSVGTPTGVRSDGLALTAVYPIGKTTITWNVADANGNVAIPITQTVTVTDNQKPVITSNGNQVVSNDKDVCGATVKVSASAADNCSIGAPVGVRSDGLALAAVYPIGTTIVNWNITDAYGNAAIPVTQTVTVTDNQKPVVLTKNITVTLVNGTATITPSQIDAGSKDNCGIKTMSVSKSTFQCGDYGDKTVTLTVVDVNGNIGSNTAIVTVKGVAPLPSIAVSRTDNTLTNLDGKTIALGYGAQQLTLSALNTTSSANATTYKWSAVTGLSSTNTATVVFKPTTAGTFVFTVTATNEFGCTASSNVTINVIDARCGNSNDKVSVCHKTGSSSNPTTQLCISPNAVAVHLGNGDNLETCPVATAALVMNITTPTTSTPEEIKGIENELTVHATPNPTTNVFRLRITSNDQNTAVTVRVIDAFGRSLNQFDKVALGSTITFGERYLDGFYFAEVFQGTQRKVVKLVKEK